MNSILNPEMPAQELRLHMGELTASEIRVVRAAIEWFKKRQAFLDAAECPTKPDLKPLLNEVANGEHALAGAIRKLEAK